MTETMSHDSTGVEWAKLTTLQSGDKVKVDGGFTCLREGTIHEVHVNAHGLFIHAYPVDSQDH